MKRITGIGGLLAAASLLAFSACTRAPAPQAQDGATGGQPAATTTAGTRAPTAGGARMARGGMMGAGMMGGMMGGRADTAAAPTARAATASAPDCPEITQGLVDEGRKVFTGQGGTCFACHGSDARGTAAGPDLADSTWLDIDGSYAAIDSLVRAGVAHPKRFPAPMPPMGGASLSAAQVCSVAAYVYSLSH